MPGLNRQGCSVLAAAAERQWGAELRAQEQSTRVHLWQKFVEMIKQFLPLWVMSIECQCQLSNVFFLDLQCPSLDISGSNSDVFQVLKLKEHWTCI